MDYALTVQKREAGNAEELREQGFVPAIVYGPDIDPQPCAVDAVALQKAYDTAGGSTLLDLTFEGNGEPAKVLIQDIQYDPVTRLMIHADFRQIPMGEEMTTDIDLNFIGEAPAVKTLGGTLVKALKYVEVKCLPKDLVHDIEVDLSQLETFDDVISVSDIKLPSGITITNDPDTTIATVQRPLTEEELDAMDAETAPSVEDIEVEEKGKAEEEGEGGEEEKE